MAKIKNALLNSLGDSVRNKQRIPSNSEIISKVRTSNPIHTAKAAVHLAKKYRSVVEPAAKMQVKKAIKKVVKHPLAKTLAVNTGGYTASTIAGSAGGLPVAIAADAGGAQATRRLLNKGYADVKAFRSRKKDETRAQTQVRAERKRKTLEKKDRRGKENIGDVTGSMIGNTAAEIGNRAGIKVPFKGAMVAVRTNKRVVDNIDKQIRGQQNTAQTIKNSAKEIVKDNVDAVKSIPGKLRKMKIRGVARERLFRSKINNKIKENPELANLAVKNFNERRSYTRRRIYV